MVQLEESVFFYPGIKLNIFKFRKKGSENGISVDWLIGARLIFTLVIPKKKGKLFFSVLV